MSIKQNTTSLQEILNDINNLPDASSGVELPELSNPGTAADLLSGKELIDGDGNKVTGTIATKTSSNLTASGATVTVPAGYYASQATKSVATGSAKTPATTVTKNPSISVNSSGLITASVSGTQSVTPTVSAGYVSSGTAGTITVSGSATKQLTTQAAQTITPGTSNKTIASGRYLTGTQTIKGDANLVASNIANGVSIFGVTGTHSGGENLDTELATQTELISQLSTILDSKASGGSGGSVETCTLEIHSSHSSVIPYVIYTSYENNSYIQHKRTISTTETVLENVLCNSSILIFVDTSYDPIVYTQDDVVVDNRFRYTCHMIQIHCTSIVGGRITVILSSGGGSD